MAIRRTKDQKQHAVLKRAEKLEYQFSSQHSKDNALASTDLLTLNTTLIKQDLLRTAMASTLVFGILIAIYFSV